MSRLAPSSGAGSSRYPNKRLRTVEDFRGAFQPLVDEVRSPGPHLIAASQWFPSTSNSGLSDSGLWFPSLSDANHEVRAIQQQLRYGNPVSLDLIACDEVLVKARRAVCGRRHERTLMPSTELRQLQRQMHHGNDFSAPDWKRIRGKDHAIQSLPDRIAATAMLYVLGAAWEPRRHFNSFGCGPERGAHAAIERICQLVVDQDWVVRMDVHHAFESISHELVLRQLARVVHDGAVIDLVERLLHSVKTDLGTGIGRGSVLSPLCADIGLNAIDSRWPQILPKFGPPHHLPATYTFNLLPANLQPTTKHLDNPIKRDNHRPTTTTKVLTQQDAEVETNIKVGATTKLPVLGASRNLASPVPDPTYIRCYDDFVVVGVGDRKKASRTADELRGMLHEVGLRSAVGKEDTGLLEDGFDILGVKLRVERGNRIVLKPSADRAENLCQEMDNLFVKKLRADPRHPRQILDQVRGRLQDRTQYLRRAGADCSEIEQSVEANFHRYAEWYGSSSWNWT